MFLKDVCLYKLHLICSLLPYFEGSLSVPLVLHEWEQCHLKTHRLVPGSPDVWYDPEFPVFSQQLYFLQAQQSNPRYVGSCACWVGFKYIGKVWSAQGGRAEAGALSLQYMCRVTVLCVQRIWVYSGIWKYISYRWFPFLNPGNLWAQGFQSPSDVHSWNSAPYKNNSSVLVIRQTTWLQQCDSLSLAFIFLIRWTDNIFHSVPVL